MKILEKIKELRAQSKKRNFKQRFDLIVNLKELNLKKAENKLDEIFTLPKGSGRVANVTFFSESGKKIEGCNVVNPKGIEDAGKDKKKAKQLVNQTDFFLSEAKLMPVVGKNLGKILAPRGMMPKPVVADVEKIVKGYKNAVRIVVNKQPIIHTVVGSEAMKDEDITENIKAFVDFLKTKLPRGKNNIKSIYLKLTMGKPVMLEAK